MTIKAFLATDSGGETYIYVIEDSKWLEKDEDGIWNISDDCDIDFKSSDIHDEYEMSETFGFLCDAVSAELERVHIPTKDEDPVELDINISINWY